MRPGRMWTLRATLLVAAGVVCACGASGSASGVSGSGAEAILLASVQRTAGQPYHAHISGNLTESLGTAVPGGLSNHFSAQFDVQAVVESSTRMAFTATVAYAGRSMVQQEVTVDGAQYISSDAGKSWTKQTAPVGSAMALTPNQGLRFLQAVGTVIDRGPGVADGVRVERYTAILDPEKLAAVAGQMTSGGGSSTNSAQAASARPLLSSSGTINASIDAAGRLVTMDGTVTLTARPSQPGGSATRNNASSSSFSMKETFAEHFFEYGAAVTVTPPPADVVTWTPIPTSISSGLSP